MKKRSTGLCNLFPKESKAVLFFSACFQTCDGYTLPLFKNTFHAMTKSMEIRCAVCRTTALVRSEPVYDGFKKIGEAFICTGCGTRYASAEETPFVQTASRPNIFREEDKPARPPIFSDDERQKCCSWCTHFVVNPFSQRCGLTNKETQATDLCVRFTKRLPVDPESASPSTNQAPASNQEPLQP